MFLYFLLKFYGEINNFYGNIPHWDTMLHTINGFLAAGIGFSLVDLLNENSDHLKNFLKIFKMVTKNEKSGLFPDFSNYFYIEISFAIL